MISKSGSSSSQARVPASVEKQPRHSLARFRFARGFRILVSIRFWELEQPGAQSNGSALRFLEHFATRDFRRRFQILRRFADVELVVQATAAQRDRYEQLRQKYQAVIKPLVLEGSGPWKGTVFVLKGQDLVQPDVTLSADGKLEIAEKVLEQDLPIAYALAAPGRVSLAFLAPGPTELGKDVRHVVLRLRIVVVDANRRRVRAECGLPLSASREQVAQTHLGRRKVGV